ncbi:MAG TPA: sensor histidine kinase, partial [Polyangia bacterium]
ETVARERSIEIVVDDSGPGLDAESTERLFERFYRGSRARTTPGFGLGLALASDVVRALGGRLDAGPSPLGGARFTIELPR